jgi:exoribonuclease-2
MQRGQIVCWWEGKRLSPAVFVADEGARARIFSTKGREQRIPMARLGWTLDEVTRSDESSWASALAAILKRVELATAELDIEEFWQLLTELSEEPEASFEAAELASLLLGQDGGLERAILAHALIEDGLYFERVGEGWRPVSSEVVATELARRERLVQRERERERCAEMLQKLAQGESVERSGDETERQIVATLRRVAVEEDGAPSEMISAARETLSAAGLRYERLHEGAFRLLRQLGEFEHDDQNLWLERGRLSQNFQEATIQAALQRSTAPLEAVERRDLRDRTAWSVDDDSTLEIDDLISIEESDEGWSVAIHIADAAAFVVAGEPLDLEAMERGVTHYFPDCRLPMLPPQISEGVASLNPGQERPALSYLVEMDREGQILRYEIVRSTVRSAGRLSYEDVDQKIAAGDEQWALFDRFARARQAARLSAGAIEMRSDDVEFKVDSEGQPQLFRITATSASRRIVSESMILVGAVAADYCKSNELEAIYRRQPAPDGELPSPIEGPVALRAARRRLKRATAGRSVGGHAALGLPAYIQVTSPLRRYQDLVMQRQIQAHLAGGVAAYDAEQLDLVLATTDPLEGQARRYEREAQSYWQLRWYQRQVGECVEAIVVENRPRTVVALQAGGREQPLPSLKGVEIGETVELVIERVDPRSGILTLRRSGP